MTPAALCYAPECRQPAVARALCMRHYQAARRADIREAAPKRQRRVPPPEPPPQVREAGACTRTAGAMTYREIAERVGLSQARVQQIERRALQKLRVAAEKSGYSLDDVLGGHVPGDGATFVEHARRTP
ncbi:MAG TPA: sigma factor-like helix-turn-helix DNA-binding protein [Polyangiaceae bacterium]